MGVDLGVTDNARNAEQVCDDAEIETDPVNNYYIAKVSRLPDPLRAIPSNHQYRKGSALRDMIRWWRGSHRTLLWYSDSRLVG